MLRTLGLSAFGMAAVAAAAAFTVSAGAAQKTGCPVGDGWEPPMTVEAVAARVFPALLPGSPWSSEGQFLTDAVMPVDKNEDGVICLRIMWGTDLNPNAKWYRLGVDVGIGPVEQFHPHDNNSNASNK
jgi:hypothetical protein